MDYSPQSSFMRAGNSIVSGKSEAENDPYRDSYYSSQSGNSINSE